ncbi:uncharacterized protein PV09_07067 [Verruconis gallopava]|uniref:Uncharacterized protein n=1 Tax=Verruconis gallopava TaxID=253628 RepID=A0A0D2A528_9PEZI|nr:uncharacterized protein PV09_07067 [Verruconis gallopava]KIW01595.1 hypothetical protein PV09_07067 [Verruconis gallopava]
MGETPELVVAVDFGMTCTGVAYANLTRSRNVYYVQRWPGRGQANENKVPTVVTYDKHTARVSSWGFLSENRYEQNSPDREYCQWFKTCVDEDHYQKLRAKDPNAAPRSQQDVDRWTEDYMQSLYNWVKSKLEAEIPPEKSWGNTRIEFVFSVPTTWQPQPTVQKFKTIVRKAGWGSGVAHTVTIGLTEAEAAAVYVACESSVSFKENDVLLVADCGGGTTDLNILRVKDLQGSIPHLQQLSVVEGKAIGSTQIDLEFEDLVYSRLEKADAMYPMNLDLETAAWTMMKSSQYLDTKCCFGQPDDLDFRVAIPDLHFSYSNPQHGIFDGHMHFKLSDLQKLFDKQITQLFALIDHQLQNFAISHPGQRVQHLVLSGGLGNSTYVQYRLRERYSTSVNGLTRSRYLAVHVSSEPQLAVCKGLCLDRVRNSQHSKPVLIWRCCRASYGTDCKILYNRKNPEHIGRTTMTDRLDGKKYIMNGIAWFIKKGEPVDVTKPIVQRFTRKITAGDPRRAFSDKVIVSHLDKTFLPLQYGEGAGADVLCRITCDLSAADEKKFKEKNRHWWSTGERYLRVQYEVHVVMGAADITFELWFEGQKLSRSNSIAVEWQVSSAPEPPFVPGSAVPVNHAIFNGQYPGGENRTSYG